MTKTRSIAALFLAVAACFAAPRVGAGDWPQFRGPSRHGVVDGRDVASEWSAPPAVVWRRDIGSGFSSVAAVGNRLFTMEASAGEEAILALDAESGATLWRTVVGEPVASEFGDGPRSTPTVHGGKLFAVTGQPRLVALDLADGAVVWEADLSAMGPAPRFGYANSPLVDGDLVVVEAGDAEGPGIAAFHRESGTLEWRALAGPAGYSSPIVAEIGGVRQYLFFRRVGPEVVAVDPAGEVLWRHPTEEAMTTIVAPIFLPPDRVFVASADDGFGGLMLRVAADEEGVFHTEELWSDRLMRNHFNNSVAVDGHLYGFDNATLRCLDAETGERRWARRGFGKGSLIAAGDRLFVLSDTGSLALVRATPDGYQEAGRVQATATAGRAWTAPSLAGGRLLVRDLDELVALDVAAIGEPGEEGR